MVTADRDSSTTVADHVGTTVNYTGTTSHHSGTTSTTNPQTAEHVDITISDNDEDVIYVDSEDR